MRAIATVRAAGPSVGRKPVMRSMPRSSAALAAGACMMNRSGILFSSLWPVHVTRGATGALGRVRLR